MEDSSNTPEKVATEGIEAVRDLLFGKRTAEIMERIDESEQSLRESILRIEERVELKFSIIEKLLCEVIDAHETRLGSTEKAITSEAKSRKESELATAESIQSATDEICEKVTAIDDRLHQIEWSELDARSKRQTMQLETLREKITGERSPGEVELSG